MELSGLVTAAAFRSPGKELEHDLSSGRMLAALDALAEVASVEPVRLPDVPLSELQEAYTRLFVANPDGLPAPPYVGYALDGQLMGSAQEALKAFYDEHGLEVSEAWNDLPDHLAAVGEAIALLARSHPEAARQLAQGYLKPWLERYVPVIAEHDVTGFYRTISGLLNNVLEGVYEAKS